MAGQTKEKDTMTNTNKIKWRTPKLRILLKTRAEEGVLAACKTLSSGTGKGASTSVTQCGTALTSCIDACSSRTGS